MRGVASGFSYPGSAAGLAEGTLKVGALAPRHGRLQEVTLKAAPAPTHGWPHQSDCGSTEG